jgi:hypothetical protein
MINERELLLQSLPPGEADWAEFEARFLHKLPDCPLTADLIEVAQGVADPATARRVQEHLPACRFCGSWFHAFRGGLQELGGLEPGSGPPGGSLPDVFSDRPDSPQPSAPQASRPAAPARPGPPPPREFSSVVLTGFATLFLAGQTQKAFQLLRPYLPDILEAVGLDASLAGRLRQFLRERAEKEPRRPPALFPDWLREFARQTLRLEDLPVHPPAGDWEPVLVRGALRSVQEASPELEVREFLQAALDRGVESPEGLELVRDLEERYLHSIPDNVCHDLIKKVRRVRRTVSPLFGLN